MVTSSPAPGTTPPFHVEGELHNPPVAVDEIAVSESLAAFASPSPSLTILLVTFRTELPIASAASPAVETWADRLPASIVSANVSVAINPELFNIFHLFSS
jgi:hypothetical protein